MKKIGLMILAVLLMVAMVACATTNPEDGKNTEGPTQAITQTPTATPEPTPATTPNPVYEEEGIFSAVIKVEPTLFYKGILTEMNGTTGVLAFETIRLNMEQGLIASDLKGPLTAKEVEIYNVSLTPSATGAYIVNGTLTGFQMSVEGEDAAKFIDAMQNTNPENELMKKLFQGETLTAKEDIEQWTGKLNCKIQFICTEDYGTVTVKEFSKEYTKQDSLITVKEVYQIVDGVIRAKDLYENGELIEQNVYDENGVKQE